MSFSKSFHVKPLVIPYVKDLTGAFSLGILIFFIKKYNVMVTYSTENHSTVRLISDYVINNRL